MIYVSCFVRLLVVGILGVGLVVCCLLSLLDVWLVVLWIVLFAADFGGMLTFVLIIDLVSFGL